MRNVSQRTVPFTVCKTARRFDLSGNRWPMAFLVMIVLLASTLRMFHLGAQSLWADEVEELLSAKDINAKGFGVVVVRDSAAPLSHWILWALIRLVGVSEITVRMPSVVAGVAAIVLLYLLGRELFSHSVGLTAAAAMAISPYALWYAQDGRMYSLLMCFSVWVMLCFWRATSGNGTRADWCSLSLATALAIYTHQFAILLSAGSALFLLARNGIRSRMFLHWLATQIIAGLLFLPWFLHSLHLLGNAAGTTKSHPLLWVPYTFFAFLFGFSLGPSIRELRGDLAATTLARHFLVTVPFAASAGLLVLRGLVRSTRSALREPTLFCFSCLVVPVVLALVVPLVSNVTYNVRYASVAFPALMLLLASGVVEARHSSVAKLMIATTLAGMVWSVNNWYVDPRYGKADMRTAAALLARQVKSDDTVIISSGSTSEGPLRYYGFEPAENTLVVRPSSLKRALAEIEQRVQQNGHGRVWLIESRTWESDPRRELRRALDGTASLKLERRWPGVTVRCYTHRKQESPGCFFSGLRAIAREQSLAGPTGQA